jgi:hypothetical protein
MKDLFFLESLVGHGRTKELLFASTHLAAAACRFKGLEVFLLLYSSEKEDVLTARTRAAVRPAPKLL